VFTGIVEATAPIVAVEPVGERVALGVEARAEIAGEVRIGDSVALSGVCLTVTRVEGSVVWFDVIPETLRLTSLGDRKPGERVNLERSLRADARLGGHIVQGHVDATGRVRALERNGEDVRVRIDCPQEIRRLLVPKGSVAIDGVSLTVVEPDAEGFSVALIPHTLRETTLGERVPGDRVNLEADVLGKYVVHYLEQLGGLPPRA
jgi:riboflavin synthase alpha subunit